jgi:predicted amidohydrolase
VGSLRVTALQMQATPGDVDGNIAATLALIREHGPGCDLVVTPELVTSGYDLDVLASAGRKLAQPVDGPGRRSCSDCSSWTATTCSTAP